MCGKEMDDFDIQQGFGYHDRASYGSEFDCQSIDLDLCSDCMDAIIKSCKISPVGYEVFD